MKNCKYLRKKWLIVERKGLKFGTRRFHYQLNGLSLMSLCSRSCNIVENTVFTVKRSFCSYDCISTKLVMDDSCDSLHKSYLKFLEFWNL